MENVNKVRRDHIEKMADEIDPTPDPGWEKMEETVREVRAKGGESNHPTAQGSQTGADQEHVVSKSGDLTEPVGTESDSS
jgi:hypothetical protein